MSIVGKTLWIFSLSNPPKMPSYVVSGIMPAQSLGIEMLIFLKHHGAKTTLDKIQPDLVIISKIFHSSMLNLIFAAKKRNIKIISIFDDWLFD